MSGSRRADRAGARVLGVAAEGNTGLAASPVVRLGLAALLLLAILVPTVVVALTLVVAGDTLGYDFRAYHAAAVRVLAGKPLYDTSFEAAGGFGLFYYPPLFAPLVLPFGLLSVTAATWLWIFGLIGAFLAGTAILPVSSRVRWLILLLAGLSWPFVYALKLGQVGPLLYLAFAIGWRWLDDPVRLGGSAALGAAIKLQPGLVLAWALLAGRWRAVLWGAVVLAVVALLATALAGIASWTDFLGLIRRVSDPITTPHNFTPGAVAFQSGVAPELASILQLMTTLAALALVVWAARGAIPEAGYLVTVVASQLVSPILWDHYAMLLLLPVAWLLERGRWWAVLIPVATAVPLVGVTPPLVYPLVFSISAIALAWDGRLPPSVDRPPASLRPYLRPGA